MAHNYEHENATESTNTRKHTHEHNHEHAHNHNHHNHNGHHGHNHSHKIESLNGIYILSIILNLGFVAIEAATGFISNSLGLVSDAGHNFSDVLSLVLALTAFKLASSKRKEKFTYGYKKSSILISLLNAIILLVAVIIIAKESIEKFANPEPVNGNIVMITAGIGIVINGLTAYLLMRNQQHDINTRGAFLHMAADTLVSIGVVISGLIIRFTGFNMIDPIIGLAIAIIILVSTADLLKESIRMSIDAVPESINIDEIAEIIKTEPGVENMHHLHVWPISTTETAMTVHIVISDINESGAIRTSITEKLAHQGISHCTIQVEKDGEFCEHADC